MTKTFYLAVTVVVIGLAITHAQAGNRHRHYNHTGAGTALGTVGGTFGMLDFLKDIHLHTPLNRRSICYANSHLPVRYSLIPPCGPVPIRLALLDSPNLMRMWSNFVCAATCLVGLRRSLPSFITNLENQLQRVARQPAAQSGFRHILEEDFDILGISRFVLGRFAKALTLTDQQKFACYFED